MSNHSRVVVYFGASAALILSGFNYCDALAAGQPTAVNNLPVVTADRHKVKHKIEKPDAKTTGDKQKSTEGQKK
jgi:hypothetical protein